METLVDILKNTDIGLKDTNFSQNIEISQQRNNFALGPYLPISSGNFNIIALETSDFESFTVTATF